MVQICAHLEFASQIFTRVFGDRCFGQVESKGLNQQPVFLFLAQMASRISDSTRYTLLDCFDVHNLHISRRVATLLHCLVLVMLRPLRNDVSGTRVHKHKRLDETFKVGIVIQILRVLIRFDIFSRVLFGS